jgi:hypothetical protein
MITISGLHILLTYQCTYECDHCFVWGSPFQTGTFTLAQLEEVLQQAAACQGVQEIYFEGGEPCIYHPLLVAAVQKAHQLGFKTGIVSNAYWAHSEADAVLWLRPLFYAGLDTLDVSSDLFHGEYMDTPEADFARRAAARLGIDASTIQIEPPSTYRDPEAFQPGAPVTGGDVMYRGRAAVKLAPPLPRQAWDSFTSCPYEDLVSPGRLHLDPLGNLHLCQGLVIGNLFQTPLAQILETYQPDQVPVVAELLAGGPAALVQTYGLEHEAGYVDACHLCYSARLSLRSRFPQVLAPDQIYGVF